MKNWTWKTDHLISYFCVVFTFTEYFNAKQECVCVVVENLFALRQLQIYTFDSKWSSKQVCVHTNTYFHFSIFTFYFYYLHETPRNTGNQPCVLIVHIQPIFYLAVFFNNGKFRVFCIVSTRSATWNLLLEGNLLD